MDKNYRIHTNIATDTVLNVNMQQDYDFLEVLTMKLRQKDAYKLHSSNYGVIIGRVLANDAFGIPNAKISVFIGRDTNDSVDMENIYPYSEVTSKDKEGRRYNLLPDYSDDDCYRIVGTFPNKRLLLDNDIQVEIYEKYWKYTTVTNNAGDYMIFGVPSGNQQIHVDIDLSDIGILSQKPRDFEYKGYNVTMFDNPNQFKESTNLESLAQLFSQEKSVFVYPFWGDADNGIAAITRADIQIQYKFEPTCVFMGSIVSDNEGNSIGHKCAPDINNGMNDQLIAGEGTIEMIRKTQDGFVEEFQIQGNQLIDSDGVWCYQIPMNLDFIGTDEYGNIVPTDDPNKGIPTRTQVRFRISKHDTGDEGFSTHTAKYLVPMNPIFSEKERIHSAEANEENSIYGGDGDLDGVKPVIETVGQEIENMYKFGSSTPQSCFRDLYWNNVYSVKNYIPKVQVAYRPYAKNYSALKGSNLAGDKNPIPFNSLRIDLPFLYIIICIIVDIISAVVWFINKIICLINDTVIDVIRTIINAINSLDFTHIIPDIPKPGYIGCVRLGNGLSDAEIFAPGCSCKDGRDAMDNENNLPVNDDIDDLKDLVVEKLAEDFKIVKLDLEQDWINGCLYMPLWYWRKRKKKTYLFGLITRSAKNQFCDCNEHYSQLKTYVTCSVKYKGNSLEIEDFDKQLIPKATDWHRKKAARKYYLNGLIKGVENKDGLTAYYYAAVQATDDNNNPRLNMADRTDPFYAFRLYATDIILLGNLNEENLYGIPQFFKVLPATTANIPPIATISELTERPTSTDEAAMQEEERRKEEERQKARENDKDNPDEPNTEEYASLDDGSDAETESGTSVTTGMNWRHTHQDDNEPSYANGLFMELACTEVYTKAKSCFNVERLSELGVNNDMQYYMAYSDNRNILYGQIKPDGLISKLELDDMENRAMFATMNHIGFVPQEYQDSISAYTTQVEDENTNYLVPKFRFIYPVDFDGRMRLMMQEYFANSGEFGQHMFDETDQSYLSFRFGADAIPNQGEFNRERHFYHHVLNDDAGIGEYYEMPLYNNSFFFYFGVNQGSTAIDKFNKLFYSECFKNVRKPFTYDVETRGKSYCASIYNDNYMAKSYGHITFKSDDIQTPLSYTLYDSYNNIVISEDSIYDQEFTIGGRTVNGTVVYNNFGAITYQNKTTDNGTPIAICSAETGAYTDCTYDSTTYNNYVSLENETYVLDVTDINGRTLSEEITLTAPSLSFTHETRGLGAKYHDEILTPPTYICDAENEFYGRIRITEIYIDEIRFKITSATLNTIGQVYVINVSATSTNPMFEGKTANVIFYLYATDDSVDECMCTNIPAHSFNFNATDGYFEFAVYKPMVYTMKMYIKCNDEEIEESEALANIAVPNGEDFDATLNKMPLKFMIGKNNSSSFYKQEFVSTATSEGVNGWYGVHNESKYEFSGYPSTQEYTVTWSNYLDIDDITSLENRTRILKFKFDKMFSLSNSAYMTNNSGKELRYQAHGGTPPNMTRAFHPDYSEITVSDNDNWVLNWIYADNSMLSNKNRIPNIVGLNFEHRRTADRDTDYPPTSASPRFNDMFDKISSYTGNYFATFTNNGRYTGKTSGDCSIRSVQIPNKAAVNVDSFWKPTNRDEEYTCNQLASAPRRVLERLTSSNTDGVCTRINTKPHFRAMFVDRKMDFDLIVWTPTLRTIKIYPNNDSWNNVLNRTRISGTTYNGIEMAYDNDENRNIISANTTADGSATPNTNLEYSYTLPLAANGDAVTKFNEPQNPTWSEGGGLKRFYTATINDRTDVRNFFWSTFNKNNLKNYWEEKNGGSTVPSDSRQSWIFDESKGFYVFKHDTDTDIYNGYFGTNNYPSKRLIDVGNIEGENTFRLLLESCSYSTNARIDENEDGNAVIICKVSAGDKLELNMSYQSIIRIVDPEDDSYEGEYANARYFYTQGDTTTPPNRWANFSAGKCEIRFKLNQYGRKGFTVYPRAARLIKVLDTDMFWENGTKKTDSLTYIKTTSKNNGLFGNNGLLDSGGKNDWYHDTTHDGRIQEATMETFDVKGINIPTVWGIISHGNVLVDASVYDDVGPRGTGYEEYYHYSRRMSANDTAFDHITFYEDISSELDVVRAFAILFPMDYYQNDLYHINHIKTIETSEIYDVRKTQLKYTVTNSGNDTIFTFTIKRNNESATYSIDMFNQAFNEECEYTCSFKNDSTLYETSSEATVDDDYVTIKVTFTDRPQDIDEWAVNIFIRTISNFLYKIRFKLKYSNSAWGLSYIKETY